MLIFYGTNVLNYSKKRGGGSITLDQHLEIPITDNGITICFRLRYIKNTISLLNMC